MGGRLPTGTHQASGDSEGGLQDEDFSLDQYINNIDYMKQQFSAAVALKMHLEIRMYDKYQRICESGRHRAGPRPELGGCRFPPNLFGS